MALGPIRRALAAQRSGRPVEAERLLRAALAAAPDDVDAMTGLALLRQERGDESEALALLERAATTAPQRSDIWNNLGATCRRLGRTADALRALRTATDRDPDNVRAWFNLGAMLFELGDLRTSAACFRRLLASVPNDPEANLRLGTTYLVEGDTEKALEVLRHASELAPDEPEVLAALGKGLVDAGRAAQAAAVLERAVERAPRYATAWKLLGTALVEAGRAEDAIAPLERAVELAPGDNEARAARRHAWEAAGREPPAAPPVHVDATPVSTEGFPALLVESVTRARAVGYYFRSELFRAGDVFLASYPRSGSHFVRFLILSARRLVETGELPGDLTDMQFFPDVHDQRVHRISGSPRYVATHFPYDPRQRTVVHLVRDPRDILASYHHYIKRARVPLYMRHGTLPSMREFVERFLRGEVWPCDLRAHTASFEEADARRLLVRYEDLVQSPRTEIPRLLAFLGLDLEQAALERLVDHVAFDAMARLHTPETARAGHVAEDRLEIFRKGIVGGYRDALAEDLIEALDSGLRAHMDALGYA